MKKLIYNKIIPFKGFVAMNLFGLIFVREEKRKQIESNPNVKAVLLNHELVHTAQYKELLFVFFLLLYLLNYVINIFVYRFNLKEAYRNICFEREAYSNQRNNDYLKQRCLFSWFKYVKNS